MVSILEQILFHIINVQRLYYIQRYIAFGCIVILMFDMYNVIAENA